MKNILIVCSLLIVTFAQAQQTTCCTLSNVSTTNAVLAMNNDFAKTHSEPKAFVLEDQKGTMIEFATEDGKMGKAYFIKAAKKSKKYLFVFHEWWGLNDYIKKEAEKYFVDLKEVNVLAIDLYDGGVATTREDAGKLMAGLNDARARAIVNGALTFAGKKAKVATLGWCMGGAWSLQTAIEGGEKVDACVMYYGFPEMNVERLKRLDSDILGIFAEKDAFINVTTVKLFEEKVAEAGKSIMVYNYVAEHAFANPSNPDFNEQAAKDAYETKVMPYLKARLKLKK
jgi:carboxymethylenebutenolidase